ncbi:hypothetical protein FAM09_12830 [Niastella caeni]|uniref:Uncharacterized protein n=1 Tax=Niastella caeni TaxID=2569763 RepID=A0A4V4H174_9BACT|nr:hypothetical protein [Niastella caeni]THU39386.1 hypothetical protein FAM09_12830 [Niastella caeni]
MKKTILRFSAAVLVASVLFACQKEMANKNRTELTSLESTSSTTYFFPTECGMFRTQTQGGWGSEPSGNNPGTYLHANFQAAFGEYLTVGCYPDNFYVKLTSAQAVTNLLPVGGKASALTASYTNPASLKNVLAGQLVALKLSVTFDAANANFGESAVSLGSMIIGSGTFAGYTVADFLVIGEQVLGGCSTQYTPQQINETASSINENFVDGTTNKGFLICPEDNGGGGEPLPG